MKKALLFLIGLLSIFYIMQYFENAEVKKEIMSINQTLAHRERIATKWADRCDFLRYVISSSNIRITVLENSWEEYQDTLKKSKEYFRMRDKIKINLKSIEGG